MDKKKNMRRMAGAMAVVVAAGAAGTCGYQRSAITAKAAETDTEKLEEVAENALSSKSDDTEETGTSKEESVYVKADPSGKVKKTTVTEWLKNTGKGTLSDTTDLDDIKNIKGDEKFKESGDELSWEAVGDDIYYQGSTDKELPVGVNISYKLDGKDISAEDLKGKDGKVEIHIKYTNTSKSTQDVNGTEEEVFTPFTMITAMMLPADQYENVQIDNGKVISDAERQIVVGLGFPGLNDNLKLEDSDLELPEEVTITADVKDATIEPSITVATTDFLQDLDTDNIDDFSDLSDSIDELKDATNQLVDGSKEAADGASQLAEGAGTLKSGTAALATGANTLVAKVPTLVSGVTALDNGASSIQGGLKELQASVDHKKDETNPEDQSGLVEGAESIQTGAQTLASGTESVYQGVLAVKQYLAAATSTSALDTAVTSLNSSTETITGTVSGTVNKEVEGSKFLEDADVAVAVAGISDPDEKAAVENALKNAKVNMAIQGEDLNGLNVSVSDDSKKSITDAATEVVKEAKTISGAASKAQEYNNQVVAGFEGTAEKKGLDGLVGGSKYLAAGSTQLATGTKKLSVGAAKLVAGSDDLKAGTSTLAAGASVLASGATQLGSGATALDEGTATLKTGADALAAGNEALAEGMSEYKTEAIDKLTSLFDGDIANVTSRLKAITDAGKDYKSFAGIKSDMSGRTKFIIETEGLDD